MSHLILIHPFVVFSFSSLLSCLLVAVLCSQQSRQRIREIVEEISHMADHGFHSLPVRLARLHQLLS